MKTNSDNHNFAVVTRILRKFTKKDLALGRAGSEESSTTLQFL